VGEGVRRTGEGNGVVHLADSSVRTRRKKKATPAGVALSNRNQLLDE